MNCCIFLIGTIDNADIVNQQSSKEYAAISPNFESNSNSFSESFENDETSLLAIERGQELNRDDSRASRISSTTMNSQVSPLPPRLKSKKQQKINRLKAKFLIVLHKIRMEWNVMLTFISVALFWASVWDLLGSIPFEMVSANLIYQPVDTYYGYGYYAGPNGTNVTNVTVDDGGGYYGGYYYHDDVIDDYDRHATIPTSDRDWIYVLIALGYLSFGTIYLVLSGALFAFTAASDEQTEQVG